MTRSNRRYNPPIMQLSISVHRVSCGGAILGTTAVVRRNRPVSRFSRSRRAGNSNEPGRSAVWRSPWLGLRGTSGCADAHHGGADRRRPPGDPAARASSPRVRSSSMPGARLRRAAKQVRAAAAAPLPMEPEFHLTPCAGFCGCQRQRLQSVAGARVCVDDRQRRPRWRRRLRRRLGREQSQPAGRLRLASQPCDHGRGKAITTRYYGKPIARSYMSGCSKGGHAALMEAQRFPDDFDGLVAVAPVYDLVGRVMAVPGGRRPLPTRSGIGAEQASPRPCRNRCWRVAARRLGWTKALVTDPGSCDWRPEMVACPAGKSESGCLDPSTGRAGQADDASAVNAKGEVVYAYPDIAGTTTEWAGWHYGRGECGGAGRLCKLHAPRSVPEVHGGPDGAQGRRSAEVRLDRGPASLERARKLYNATSPDLRASRRGAASC